jgi:hypothetical protein
MPRPSRLQNFHLWWYKLVRFEYWPYWIFYLPVVPYILYLAIRRGSLSYFTNVNPGIYLSGIVGESKSDILQKLPAEYLPTSIYFDGTSTAEQRYAKILEVLSFPFILKPDVGERGNSVEKISDANALKIYLAENPGSFIAQEFIEYPLEFGVMYYHIPESNEFKVTSIVQKGFLKVVGDGQKSMKALLAEQKRALLVWNYLEEHLGNFWDQIIPAGKEVYPQPIGNHCKGTMFLDAQYLMSTEVSSLFHSIAKQVPEFYYGRFDVKVQSTSDLFTGTHLRIMELNGLSSEPAHIYDPNYKLMQAYADLMKHMKIIFRISKANEQRGFAPAKTSEFIKLLRSFYSPANA